MTGQPYSLTCTVQVVQYLVVSPDVTWLAPDGSSLGNVNGFTVRKAVKNGNITTLRLRVDELAESHTGNYTCRACTFIDKAAIEGHCRYAVAEVTLSGKILYRTANPQVYDKIVIVSMTWTRYISRSKTFPDPIECATTYLGIEYHSHSPHLSAQALL